MTEEGKPALGPRAGWPKVMMAFAEAAATRSRDATTRVGAVVCTPAWRVVGTGYNGPPAGSPDALPMAGPERHGWVIHAEENAILQAGWALGGRPAGCLLFSTLRPCAACVLRAAHAGIGAIFYGADELSPEQEASALAAAVALGMPIGRVE
jgi:deoxycytidylate deaminase